MTSPPLPGYSALLAAYHRAFSPELQTMIGSLPLCGGDQVLDMGCGDGSYTGWLASRVLPDGKVTAVDLSRACLNLARTQIKKTISTKDVRFVQGDIRHLPFETNRFDLAWCAQSFYSFPDPLQALCELTRVTRRGGVVAVLENDSFHQVLLPWPAEVELMLCAAEYQAFQIRAGRARKFYIGRNLRELFAKAGLKPQRKKLYASQRETPLGHKEALFLQLHLRDLRERTRPFLNNLQRQRADSYLDPRSPHYLLKRPELTLTCLDHLVWGKKP